MHKAWREGVVYHEDENHGWVSGEVWRGAIIIYLDILFPSGLDGEGGWGRAR